MIQTGPLTERELELYRIQVLSIAEGFFQSSILFALLKLNIFSLIGDGSKTVNELAATIKANPETLIRLLNAGVVLQLLISTDGVNFTISDACRAILLPSAGENYLGDFIKNMDYFRLALSKLDEAVLKSGPTVDSSSILGVDKAQTRAFALAMHNNASYRGKELAIYLNTTDCMTLLDLGCGPGTYAFHLGMRNPHLKLYLLDGPEILEVAKEIQNRYSIKNEVHYLPLNALRDDIPGTYDIVLVSNMLHMLGEQASRSLIKKLYKSINRGGSLVIQAQFLRDDRMGDRWPVFMDLIQLCITSEGRNHSMGETGRWLEDAGFMNIEYNRMSILNPNSFFRGYKP